MKKLYTFGALRMEFMRLNKNREVFRAYLEANYTLKEQERIREAFLTLGTKDEVPGGERLADDRR